MGKFRLDELDHGLIALLSEDARVSNRQIADRLNVSESTVRFRLKRMQAHGVIRITAVTNTTLAGSPRLFMFGINAGTSAIPVVTRKLCDLKPISSVVLMFGRYSVFATGFFGSLDEADELIGSEIRSIKGVESVDISKCLRTYKYDALRAQIL